VKLALGLSSSEEQAAPDSLPPMHKRKNGMAVSDHPVMHATT